MFDDGWVLTEHQHTVSHQQGAVLEFLPPFFLARQGRPCFAGTPFSAAQGTIVEVLSRVVHSRYASIGKKEHELTKRNKPGATAPGAIRNGRGAAADRLDRAPGWRG